MEFGRRDAARPEFIEFVIAFRKRLIKNAVREIFLIVDRGSAHRAKKAGAFAPTPGWKLRLFYGPTRCLFSA